MSLRKALLATTLLLVPGAASAQQNWLPGWGTPQPRGFYIGAGVGANWMQDSDLDASGPLGNAVTAAGISRSGSASFDVGWVGLVSLGYAFGNGVRVEVEGSYRENDINGISGFNGIPAPRTQSGDVYSWGVMANVFYDFNLGWNYGAVGIVPYIGAGAGYVQQSWDNVTIRGPAGPTGGALTIDGDHGDFAYQLIAGAAFPIGAVPGLALTAEYRFMQSLSGDIDTSFTAANGTVTRGTVNVDNFNHSVLVGLRYTFGVTPPPPPVAAPVAPAAAPAPARTYLVFFDWDRADLTDRARQIIADAAQASRTVQTTRLEVSGHADRSGTPQYNQRLSERRAQAVASELERQGVPRSAMVIQAFGESRPLVPTADGVREPQNRRVEIVLR